MTKKTYQYQGFTLIELMVVIAIIALLSSIVLVALSSARIKAKYAAANEEMHQIINSIVVAQQASGETLVQITGDSNTISDSGCFSGTSMINVPITNSCYLGWVNVVTKVDAAQGSNKSSGLTNILRDPWGSPFSVDENEHELGPNDCRRDVLYSAGADGIFGTTDDLDYNVPPLLCPGS